MVVELAINGGKPIRDKYLIFGSPRIEEDEIEEVLSSLRSGWLGTGPKVQRFQELFQEYIGAKHGLALNSCTAALHLAMLVSGIRPEDEVITTPMTFAATANVIEHVEARPVFVDINKNTMNIDEDSIESRITTKTKAILPVHFAGRPCNMDRIMSISRDHNLLVIEDAAHAIEAVYRGQKIGNISDITCFSFYVTKNLCTGEGGMVTTNNEDWAEKIKIMGLHGLSRDAWMRYSDKGFKHYEVIYPGFKYNMMDLQAAIGIHQLGKLSEYLKRREQIWQSYNQSFKDLPIMLPKDPEPDTTHARHLYTILLKLEELKCTRDEFINALHHENIGVGVHFKSLHLHQYYREKYGFNPEDFPNALFVSERTISLPLSAKLIDKDVEDVINAVKKVVEFYQK